MNLPGNVLKIFKKGTLLDTVVLVVLSLIIIIVVTFGGVVSRMLFDVAVKQTESRAVQAVYGISHFIFQDNADLEYKPETFRQEINAERVVILVNGKVRYFPEKAPREAQVSLALDKAAKSKSFYILHDRINNMPAITAVGPINKGEGAAAVSYPLFWVETVISKYFSNMVFFIFIFITFALISAVIIAKKIKKSIFWLEPYEIAVMFQELSAIVESIREAVVSTDIKGRVKLMNGKSTEIFGDIKGMKFQEIVPELKLTGSNGELKDMEVVYNGTELLMNIMPLFMSKEIIGFVATIRKKDEIEQIAKELTQVQEYAQMLRAQTHEFNNRMHAIVGMVQMGEYGGLLEYIMELSEEQKYLAHNLKTIVSDHALMSLLLGKYMTASEKKIKFRIDEESSMLDVPKSISRTHLLTIVGNIIDNAFDASLENKTQHVVTLSMSDYGKDLIFEVEDSGSGIPVHLREKVFERGYSSKSQKGRGLGMYLMKNAVTYLKGSVTIEDGDMGGALITVIIPKNHGG
ncbi:ATP-binding protein [Seleniivibrio sp.]|uniref:sensor histidine kinase n=1 Tax=Seleniivibrio sp. TaxID=2898801 RepID=UPI0025DB92B4|nr:ATP-binding protein [Seleniivibrio sp.]MCD8554395.1 ATP-binding protein [Seleniivibrio sp.]